MAKFNRDEKYIGHSNEEIISLTQSLNDCEAEKRRIEGDIKEIRESCDHEFVFVCSGMYEDAFTCKHCGEDGWN